MSFYENLGDVGSSGLAGKPIPSAGMQPRLPDMRLDRKQRERKRPGQVMACAGTMNGLHPSVNALLDAVA